MSTTEQTIATTTATPIQFLEGALSSQTHSSLPPRGQVLTAQATPRPTIEGKVRGAFGAHFVEVSVGVVFALSKHQ